MKKGLSITLGAIVGIIVILAFLFAGIYNKLIAAEEGVASAWAQVENVYQRRLDLVPNLVNVVKGYAAHERETLQGVVNARSRIGQMNVTSGIVNNPEMMARFQEFQGELSSALSRLLVVVERYPDLKASQNFLALQAQLEGTENRISVERRRFNEAALFFNTQRRIFPNRIIAGMMGLKEKAYFKAEEAASAAPTVTF